MTACFVLNPPIHFLPPPSTTINHWCLPPNKTQNNIRFSNPILHLPTQSSSLHSPRFSRPTTTAAAQTTTSSMAATVDGVPNASMNLLFVEMGVGYDQHGYSNMTRLLVVVVQYFCLYVYVSGFRKFCCLLGNFINWMPPIITGKMLLPPLCGLAGMPSLPIRFPPSEEVCFKIA